MKDQLPSGAAMVAERHPDVWRAFAALGDAVANSGPIDPRTRRLVKLALAVGARSEGAVHSHVRRALEMGIEPEALRQVALMAVPTLGFPTAVAAMTWIEDIVSGTRQEMPDTGSR